MARRSSLTDTERHFLQEELEKGGHKFFKPTTELSYLPMNFDNEASLFRLPDEQVGLVLRRLFEYAHGYLSTFDASLLPDDDGLTEGGAMILSVLAGFVKRQYDYDRIIAFSRTSGGHAMLVEHREREKYDDYDDQDEK